ncbi:hypothetical protein RchiOBHm_Chr5g0026051 [Rosa chinensis]|uniref:Uncharacterized protein n=1 Tax=Rosa chinensis TaxID=74649 RepID=A0A2P6Q8R1_ROSCH|nr:hypothetical protein RchiOBHm_Chr5g0026051 [Rosa chinensis]
MAGNMISSSLAHKRVGYAKNMGSTRLYDVRLLYGKWLACGIISSYN